MLTGIPLPTSVVDGFHGSGAQTQEVHGTHHAANAVPTRRVRSDRRACRMLPGPAFALDATGSAREHAGRRSFDRQPATPDETTMSRIIDMARPPAGRDGWPALARAPCGAARSRHRGPARRHRSGSAHSRTAGAPACPTPAHDYAGALLSDPMNIRYATGARNMAVWTMHGPGRYAFVATEAR